MDRDGPITDSVNERAAWRRCCSLCAVAFATFRPDQIPSHTPEHIGRLIQPSHPYISGQVLWMDTFGILKVATDPSVDLDHVDDESPLVIERNIGYVITNSEFVVHDSCWKVIVQRLPSRFTEFEIARGLHHLFMATITKAFPNLLTYMFARNIPGSRGSCNRQGVDHVSPFSELDNLFNSDTTLDQDLGHSGKGTLRLINNTTDPFARLPVELLSELSEHLSMYSFCKLRQASRAFALVTHCQNLHRGFWLSRFAPGGEFDFLSLPESYLQLLSREKLQSAYAVMKGEMQTKDSPSGEWLNIMRFNREMLRAASRTVHHLINAPKYPLDEKPVHTGRYPPDLDVGMACNTHWDLSRRLARAQIVELTLRTQAPEKFDGCNAETHLEAFFLPFFGANMLCGMSVAHGDDLPYEIGNVNTALSSRVTIPPNSRIKRVEVSATQEGVMALHLRIEGTPGYLTLRAGRPLDMYKNVLGRSVLRIPEGSTLRGIRLQFDSVKCHAVRLLLDPHPMLRPHHEHLWHGTPPRIDRFTMKGFVRPSASMWCYHMNFGGRHGEKLKNLSSIKTLTNRKTGALHGMCFRYTDGREVRYGGAPCWPFDGCLDAPLEVKECLISGFEGEEVKEFMYRIGRSASGPCVTGRTYEFIAHLSASTNFQRTLELQSRFQREGLIVLRGGSVSCSRIQRIVALNAGTTLVGGPFQILEVETTSMANAQPQPVSSTILSGAEKA